MRPTPAPLRFLAAVCLGWTCLRAGALWLTGGAAPAQAYGIPVSAPRASAAAGPAAAVGGATPLPVLPAAAAAYPIAMLRPYGLSATPTRSVPARASAGPPAAPRTGAATALAAVPPPLWPEAVGGLAAPSPPRATAALLPLLAPPPRRRRWSLSAWAFMRSGDATPLAPAGMLGGSQAGMRGTYRIAGPDTAPLALSLRLASAIARPRGAEAAAGLDWKPAAALPVHLLLERRQRLGRDGRSAFGATLYGGGEAKLGPLRVDGYGQAGLVGLRRRDLFADGAVRAALPVGALCLGAGAWAAAQPALSRIDLGPHAELRLPLRRGGGALSADWRFRVAGNARPGSGPALTLAADF